MPVSQYHNELQALRALEKALRACGLPSIMVSGQPQLESLAAALAAVVAARNGVRASSDTPRAEGA